jgi:arginase
MAEFGVVEAPSSLGLWPSGVQDAPRVLLEMGLGTALSAAHLGRVEPEAYDPRRDPSTLILNAPSIALYATRLDVSYRSFGQGRFSDCPRRRLQHSAWARIGFEAARPIRTIIC